MTRDDDDHDLDLTTAQAFGVLTFTLRELGDLSVVGLSLLAAVITITMAVGGDEDDVVHAAVCVGATRAGSDLG